MYKTFQVALRDFLATVTTKGFILSVVFPPIVMGIVFVLMPLLLNKAAPKVEGRIAIIDRSGKVVPKVEDAFTAEKIQERMRQDMAEQMRNAPVPGGAKGAPGMPATLPAPTLHVEALAPETNVDDAKAEILKALGLEKDSRGMNPRLALAVIPEEAVEGVPAGGKFPGYDFFVAPKLDFEVRRDIQRQISRAVVDARIEEHGLSVGSVRGIMESPEVKTLDVTREGDKSSGSEVAQLLLPGAFMFLLWISVFTGGQFLLTSTIEEKSSRVMEVLLSAVSPIQLLTGKIFGQMGVGLVILVAYAGMGIGGLVLASMAHMLDWWNLVFLGIYFIIAFFLIASLMAAVGSAVSDVREAQALMSPIMIVLIIPMVLWMPIMRNPNSMFAQVCSFIPPINPFVMVLRISGSEKIPSWQIPASILVGILGAVVAAWAAAKVFRVGVLMYGKPPNFRTLIKWVRMA
jgi:ABC-2 type transport system permease protein